MTAPQLPFESLDNGTYLVERMIFGSAAAGVLEGRRIDGSPVQIATLFSSTVPAHTLMERFHFGVPGFPPLWWAGNVDDVGRSPRSQCAIVEPVPMGRRLSEVEVPFEPVAAVGVCLELCQLALAAQAHGQRVFVADPRYVFSSRGRVTGWLPRAVLFSRTSSSRSTGGGGRVLSDQLFGAPEDGLGLDPHRGDDAFAIAVLLAWLASGHYPYERAWLDPEASLLAAMMDDERDAFEGIDAIGRVLDQVLVGEPTRRISLAEFRDELERLAKTL